MSVYVAPAGASAAAGTTPRRQAGLGARLTTGLLVLSVLLGAVVAAGFAFGYRGQVVLSGSMRPALAPGDMIVAHEISATEIRAGQIISFAAPGDGRTMTHRVTSARATGSGMVAVVTRGDANSTSEHWKIATTGTVGEIVATIPKVGYATRWAASPDTRILVFSVIGLLLLALGLRSIWRN